jgi:hypothetical protein
MRKRTSDEGQWSTMVVVLWTAGRRIGPSDIESGREAWREAESACDLGMSSSFPERSGPIPRSVPQCDR